MMDSDLHVNVLNAKLNPELPKYIDIAGRELNYAWDIDVPKPKSKPTRLKHLYLELEHVLMDPKFQIGLRLIFNSLCAC